MVEKSKSILNLNIEIHIQKPEFAFWVKYLTNFLLASMSFTYKAIINNLNKRNVLTLEEIVYVIYIKKTKFTNFEAIKEEIIYFAACGRFWRGQSSWKEVGTCRISWNANRIYAVQSYSLRPTINYYYCKNDGHWWKNNILYW